MYLFNQGSAYKQASKQKAEKQEKILKQTSKIDTFFKKDANPNESGIVEAETNLSNVDERSNKLIEDKKSDENEKRLLVSSGISGMKPTLFNFYLEKSNII